MSFGDDLRKIRESKGMTVNQLAMYSGVSAASISRYETGDRGTPKPPTIEKLARGLKMEYNELMKIAGHLRSEEEPEDEAKSATDKLLEYLEAGLTDEEISQRMDFFVDIMKLDDEQVKEFMSFVRWQLSKKNEQAPASKSDGL